MFIVGSNESVRNQANAERLGIIVKLELVKPLRGNESRESENKIIFGPSSPRALIWYIEVLSWMKNAWKKIVTVK